MKMDFRKHRKAYRRILLPVLLLAAVMLQGFLPVSVGAAPEENAGMSLSASSDTDDSFDTALSASADTDDSTGTAASDAEDSTGTAASDADDSAADENTSGREFLCDYLGFTRDDLVSYLYDNMSTFVGTPYHESPTEVPTPGSDGHMQCEGFIWYVLHAVATENTENIPCGDASTEPYANGGGWVNWLYHGNVRYETYASVDDMLASGTMRKGDIIWLFDAGGPFSYSDYHHTGFFWGDTPSDNRFWHSSELALSTTYAGEKAENRISEIEGMTEESNISVIWVIYLDGSGALTAAADNSTSSQYYGAESIANLSETDALSYLPEVSDYDGVFDADYYRKQLSGSMTEDNSTFTEDGGKETIRVPRGDVDADSLSDQELLQYFLLSGVWYGDQASEDFNISAYMTNNSGLAATCGQNRLAWIQHYLEEGKAAGENALPSAEALSQNAGSLSGSSAEPAVISASSEEAAAISDGSAKTAGAAGIIIFLVIAAAGAAVGVILWKRFRYLD